MIPGGVLVADAPITDYLEPDNRRRSNLLEDFERGALAINDPDGGLEQANWRVAVVDKAITVQNLLSGPAVTLVTTSQAATEVSLTFDGNMSPVLAWVESGETKFRWYDTAMSGYVVETLAGTRSPRLTLDDKRSLMNASRDVLLIYVKTGTPERMAYRQQRDRYLTEYILMDLPANFFRLGRVGMAKSTRLQIELITR